MKAAARIICAVLASAAPAVAVAACGGGSPQDVNEPKGNFPVSVAVARMPSLEHLSQHTRLMITVRNVGTKPIPNVAVTICNVSCAYPASQGQGTSVQAFSQSLSMAHLATNSRPVWIVDRPPGPCTYSCKSGGAGAAATAYSNTWSRGRLQPGQSAVFVWGVTAVKPGFHTVAWEVAAGLNGKAKAVLQDGSIPSGSFSVLIRTTPQQTCVTNNLKITTHCQAGT